MKTIEAYKCNYCNKVYQLKKSCQAHENRCYSNPKTRSCASCIFLKKSDFAYQPGYFVYLITCLRNHNTPKCLETACNDYHYKKAKCDLKAMQQIRAAYNPEPFIRPHLEKCIADDERRRKEYAENNVEDMEQSFDAPF